MRRSNITDKNFLALKNKYSYSKCFVVGKGKSFDNINPTIFSNYPVIAINETSTALDGRVGVLYGLQLDNALRDKCGIVKGDMIVSPMCAGIYPNEIILNLQELKSKPSISICIASKLAVYFGCTEIVYVACDFHQSVFENKTQDFSYCSIGNNINEYNRNKSYVEQIGKFKNNLLWLDVLGVKYSFLKP